MLIYDIIPPDKLKEFAKEKILGIRTYKTKRRKYFAFGWRAILLFFIVSYFISGLTPIALFRKSIEAITGGETKIVNLYTGSCAGDSFFEEISWQNPQNAQGTPEIGPTGDISQFSEENSAVYKTGQLNLVCQNFAELNQETEGEQATSTFKETAIINVTTTEPLPPSVTSSDAIQTTSTTSTIGVSATTTSTTTDQESPTSFFNKIKKSFRNLKVWAQSEDTGFKSAKIKFSFAVREKGSTTTNELFPDATEQIATTTQSQATSSETETNSTSSEDSIGFWDKVKFFFRTLIVKAEENGQNATNSETILETEPQSNGTTTIEVTTIGSTTTEATTTEAATTETTTTEEVITTTSTPSISQEIATTTDESAADIIVELLPIDKKIIIWYSLDGEAWWQLDVIPNYPSSNALNGGYFEYEAPFLKNWEDTKNLRIKFEGVNDETDITAYLDAVWVEVKYQQQATKDKGQKGIEVEVKPLKIADGKEINFTYTDDNSDENLIIKTDQKTYIGLTRAYVYFSITNIGEESETVNLQIHFPEDRGEIRKIENWQENIPYQVDIPDYGTKTFICEGEWKKFLIPEEIITPGEIKRSGKPTEAPGGALGEYQCQSNEEIRNCDSLSENNTKCKVNEIHLGSHEETKYKDDWQSTKLSSNSLSIKSGFFEKLFGKELQTKPIPSNFKVKKSTAHQGYIIFPDQTQYFKMEINFPVNSSGEFYIETIGDKKGYGLLDPWWNSSWSYRKQITIDYTKIDATLTNFPILISTSSDSDLAADAQDDGDDIAFTNAASSVQLDHEIEKYASSTGELVAWVEIPSLSSSSDTIIYMYYGNTTCGSQENAAGVWGSDYLGVWHLTETPDVDSYAYDSTLGNDGTFSAGMTSADQVDTGPIAGSLEFDGSTDYIDITITTGATLTISTWATLTGVATNDMLWCLNNAGTGGPDLFFASNVGIIALNTWDSFSNPFCNAPGSGWHHYVAVISSGDTRLYVDGVSCGTATYKNPTKTSFAISSSNAYDWTGGIDEMRLYSGALTGSWAKTEYNNQNSPSTFYTLGAEEQFGTLTQNYYRWYENADSVQPGTAKAAENTAITGVDADDILRIRMSIQRGEDDLATSSVAFKLQYAQATSTCDQISTWSDVDSIAGSKNGALWRGYNNATPVDGATTTSVLLTPSDKNESYEEENPSVSNLNAIATGEDGEWDWAITNYAAPPSTDYCFRMVKSGGDALDTYNNYPKLTTGDKGGWVQTTDSDFNAGVASSTAVSEGNVKLAADASTIDKGDGSDGSLTVTTTDTVINHYAYITDATVSSGTTTVNVNDATNFSAGDEILIIQIQANSAPSNAGVYEFRDIDSINGNEITVDTALTNDYYSNDFDNETADAAQIVRVPQYTTVTVNSEASIIASAWDGYKGGIVVFRATGAVTVSGAINVSEKGYRGGLHGTPSSCASGEGEQGESYPGKGACGYYDGNPDGDDPNGGGAGVHVTGGGGGYGTAGTDSESWNGGAASVGQGGLQHGVANLTKIFLGSGGGGCYQGGSLSGDGGDGGGIIIVFASSMSVSGGMESKGQDGQGYGQGSYLYGTGGGSGGSIYITAADLTVGDNLVSATGGTGYQTTRDGGDGGVGRIRLDYASLSGTTDPSPGYTGSDFGYYSSGTIASQVHDCGSSYSNATWHKLSWMETLEATTDITFETRASDTSFTKDAASPSWTDLGSASSTSPITSGLPSGRYQQWRATLTNTDTSYTPTLHEALIIYGLNVTVGTIGSQTSQMDIPSTNQYVGGAFTIKNLSSTSTNVTGIIITEHGTVDAQNNLDNIKLYYDLDISDPYNCASEQYDAGSDSQFGSTTTFNGVNGTSTFTGSVSIYTTTTMCVYVVLDVGSGASNSETLEIKINDPSTEITVSSGTIGPATAVEISGTTGLGNLSPVVSNVSLNNGSNIDLTESTTVLVTSTATVSDSDGYSDLTSVQGKIYRSGVGQGCTLDDNDCYQDSTCATSSCAGNSCTATCEFNVQFHADPTVTGTPWNSEYWTAWIEATDFQSQTGSATNTNQTIEMNDLLALDVTTLIYYGDLYPSSTTDPLSTTTQVVNTGNCSLDITLYGINMTSGGDSISVGQQKYATSSLAYAAAHALQLSPGQELELNLAKTTDSGNKQTTDIYWGIQIPDPQATGNYSGQNTLSGQKSELPWP